MALTAAQIIYYYYGPGGGAPANPPEFALLSDLQLVLDSTGLVENTTNDYGIVNSAGNPTTWKSIAPGPTSRDFVLNGTTAGLKLVNGVIYFDGTARPRHATAATWNFMSFNSTLANLKWTAHILCRIGYEVRPDMALGLFGNNANSTANKGVHVMPDDRQSISRNARVNSIITRSVGSSFVANSLTNDDAFVPNEWVIVTVEMDGSKAQNARQKIFINKTEITFTSTANSDAPVTTPTFNLDIGAVGNAINNFVGAMSHVVIQSRIESAAVRNAFIDTLIPWKNYFNNVNDDVEDFNVNARKPYTVYNTLNPGTIDYFNYGLEQNPLSKDTILQIYHNGDQHALMIGKKLSMRKSTDRGRTFGSESDIYAPTTTGIQGATSGYDNNGRIHVMLDTHIPTPHEVFGFYLYSDNNGTTWSTPEEITSLMPDDGNNLDFRFVGRIIQHKGFLYAPFHKGTFNDGGNAIYVFKKPVSSGQWEAKLVSTSAEAVFISEPTVESDGTRLYVISRNESTKEYSFSASADDAETWSAQVNLTLGETLAAAGPGFLTSFVMSGVRVLAFYYVDRAEARLKVVYGKASEVAANGVSGFDLDTKTELYQGAGGVNYVHYGNFCHYNGNFNAIGSLALEPSPVTNTENSLIAFDVTSTNYHTIKTALGL
jgi:hypothetical protein